MDRRERIGEAPLWSVILAGGEGERIRPFIERWLGHHKPKQFCTFAGERSMLQRTVDRADALASPARRVTVVARERLQEARQQLRERGAGVLVPQPANRGTAAGALLALARIASEEPGAVVALYPSDHFVHPEDRFVAAMARAVASARERPDKIVLLGVEPEGAERDYGWIDPGPRLRSRGGQLNEVAAFVEKPSMEESETILARGGLWNSMIVVGMLARFWNLAWRHVPELMPLFTFYRDAVGTSREREVLDFGYELMPSRDLSRDILQAASAELAVMRLEEVLWSDWGRPERIAETLRSIGVAPAFSKEHLEVSARSA